MVIYYWIVFHKLLNPFLIFCSTKYEYLQIQCMCIMQFSVIFKLPSNLNLTKEDSKYTNGSSSALLLNHLS